MPTYSECLGEKPDGIEVDACVEVHRDLDLEDDGEDGPFPEGTGRIAKSVSITTLLDLYLAIFSDGGRLSLIVIGRVVAARSCIRAVAR